MPSQSDSTPVLAAPAGCAAPRAVPTELHLAGEEAGRLAAGFKALGHPVRLQVLDLLSRYGGDVCVCQIERHFSLTQPTISHHLKVLRDAGLIDGEARGLWVYYRLKPGVLDALRALLAELGQALPD